MRLFTNSLKSKGTRTMGAKSPCLSRNSYNSKEKFSEFDSLQSKTGDKVSSNIGNSLALINNSPANNLLLISDDMKKLLGNKKDIRTFCSLKNTSKADELNL